MTREDKDILLKYLCMALPYGVIVEYNNDGCLATRELGLGSLHDFMFDNAELKPYLRSMSSMTDEERNLIRKYCDEHDRLIYDIGVSGQVHSKNIVDWLNAHHFDYRGLIEKGLAIEVTENNNPYGNS